ncbi:MAG TPA: hypothetical protein PKA37_06365 [Planctomycetota bacterium]|nr:hypothetical protein [Planctomycetota bacterium]
MGNTTTHMHPTRLFEAVGAKRTVGHRLLEFFTHRPFAKLVSLGLATLLVFLIDSELTDDLYYEPINVVTEGQGKSRNDLEVQIHPDFIILPLAADEEKPRLRIRGFKKLKEEIPVPLKASIPESRLVGVGDEPVAVSVEPRDMELPDFGRGGISFSRPPTVMVVRRARAERTLAHRDSRVTGVDTEFAVTFTPARIRLSGPGGVLRSIPEPIVVNVDSASRRILRAGDLGLPPQVLLIDGTVTMTVEVTGRHSATLKLSQVVLKAQVDVNSPYEFEFQIPDDKGILARDVHLEGTTLVVEQLKNRIPELKERIYALAYLEEAAEGHDAAIRAAAREKPEDPEWVDVSDVLVAVPNHLLTPFQLKATQEMRTSARVRLRPVGRDAPDK